MDWIESQLDEESIFPQKLGNQRSCLLKNFPFPVLFLFIVQCPLLGTPFPANFKEVVKTIFKRLFRVYAHIYHSHFQKIVSLKEEAHLNTCFKHFILFTHVSHSFKSAYFYNLLLLLVVSFFIKHSLYLFHGIISVYKSRRRYCISSLPTFYWQFVSLNLNKVFFFFIISVVFGHM